MEPRNTPKKRFVIGMFRTIPQAENMLRTLLVFRETNTSVMKATGVILDSPHFDGAELTEYAIEVMEDQDTTEQDIQDVTDIIAEMRGLEALGNS
jgi:hypothetical protein